MKLLDKIIQKQLLPKKEKEELIKRAARVPIKGLHNLKLLIDGDEYDVANISSTGVAFFTKKEKFDLGKRLEAEIRVNNRISALEIEVVQFVGELNGCKILDAESSYVSHINHYFKSEIAAIDIFYIGPDRLNKDDDGTPHWYQKGDQFELYFTEKNEQVNKFEVTFLGNFISMDISNKIKTGIEWEEDRDNIAVAAESSILLTENLPKDIYYGIIRFLENIENLNVKYKKSIISKIEMQMKVDWPD